MPKFGENTGQKRNAALAKARTNFAITEEQCHCCTHENRRGIDRLLAVGGFSYTDIGKSFGVSASSVSNHAKEHLNIEDAAIQRIIQREADVLEENIEEGVKGMLLRRVYLEAVTQKGLRDLENVKVTPRDMAAMIELAEKLDQQIYGVTTEELKRQFAAYLQAMKEITSPEQQILIASRTKELLGYRTEELNP